MSRDSSSNVNEDAVVIRVWLNTGSKVGHVSLQTREFDGDNTTRGIGNGIYVSIYPKGRGQALLNFDGGPIKTRTLQEDNKKYKNKNVIKIELHHLDISKIEKSYASLVREGQFNFALLSSIIFFKRESTHNCAGIVAYLLKSGGIDTILMSKKRPFHLLLGLISNAASMNILPNFLKTFYAYNFDRIDVEKFFVLITYSVFSSISVYQSNLNYSAILIVFTTLSSSMLGWNSLPKLNAIKLISPLIKVQKFFGISAESFVKSTVRFSKKLENKWYAAFFLKSFSQPVHHENENLDISAGLNRIKNRAPNLNPTAILTGAFFCKNFIENMGWAVLSFGLAITAAFTGSTTTETLRKKIMITPGDIASLGTEARNIEQRKEIDLQKRSSLRQMVEFFKSPTYSGCLERKIKAIVHDSQKVCTIL